MKKGQVISRAEPIYKTIFDELVGKIKNEDMRKLSVNTIADEYKVNRNTAVKVLNLLETKGWVEKIRWKGTFPVKKNKPCGYSFNVLYSFDYFYSQYLQASPHAHAMILKGMFGSEFVNQSTMKFIFIKNEDSFETKREKLTCHGPKNGLIILDPQPGFEDLVTIARQERIPYMTATSPDLEVNMVSHKNYEGTFKAVDYLIKVSNRKKILFLSSDKNNIWHKSRFKAYIDAHQANGLEIDPNLIVDLKLDNDNDIQRLVALLKAKNKIDGIFAASFVHGEKIYDMMKILGVRIPQEVALIVFHDTPLLGKASPTVTVVRPPLEKIGAIMIEKLVEMMDFGFRDDIRILLDDELIIREST